MVSTAARLGRLFMAEAFAEHVAFSEVHGVLVLHGTKHRGVIRAVFAKHGHGRSAGLPCFEAFLRNNPPGSADPS